MEVIRELIERNYINYQNYFLDGTKIEANANRYWFVWKKNQERNGAKLEKEIRTMQKALAQKANGFRRNNEAFKNEKRASSVLCSVCPNRSYGKRAERAKRNFS